MMPRRVKPPGKERWTWAEIDAGRRLSKSEKRWRRMGKDFGWAKQPDGSYRAPTEAQPFVLLLGLAMLAMGVCATIFNAKKSQQPSPEVVGWAVLIFVVLIPICILCILAMAEIGPGRPPSAPRPRPTPAPKVARPPFFRPLFARAKSTLLFVITLGWVSSLPDWAQPVIWGMACGIPIALLLFLIFR
jgi:hypothetical protein